MGCRAGAVVVALAALAGCTNDFDGILPIEVAGSGPSSPSSAGPASGGGGASSSAAAGPGGAGGAGGTAASSSAASSGGAATGGNGGSGGSGGASCPLMALQDTFMGNTVDPAWDEVEENGGIVAIQGNMLKVHPAGIAGSRAELVSKDTFDFAGCSMTTRRAKTFPDAVPAASYMKALVDPGGTWLRIGVNSGNITFEVRDGGDDLGTATIAFSPEAHTWWRIREDSGLVYFETSQDASSWTVQLTAGTPPFASAVHANLGASAHQDTPNDPGEAHFESFNQ